MPHPENSTHKPASYRFLIICLLSLGFLSIGFEGAKPACAEKPQRVLRNLREYLSLSKEDAARGFPIQLEVSVIYSDPEWGILFVQDSTSSTFLSLPGKKVLYPLGTRLQITAQTGGNQNGITMLSLKVQAKGMGVSPQAIKATVEQVDAGGVGGQWVEAVGVLHPCNEVRPRPCFRLIDGDKGLWITVRDGQFSEMSNLIGATASVRGVVTDYTDAAGKVQGKHLFVNSKAEIAVQDPPLPANSAPTAISQLAAPPGDAHFVHQVPVHGIVIWSSPDLLAVQDATGMIFADRHDKAVTHTGEHVNVVGFPHMGEFGLELDDSFLMVHASRSRTLSLTPLNTTIAEAFDKSLNGKRIRVRAKLLSQGETSNSTIYHFEEGGTPFTAVLLHGPEASSGTQLPQKATVDLTGIVVLQGGDAKNPRSILILPETPADLVVRTGMEWLTVRVALAILGGMFLLILAPLVWVRQLRLTVQRQTAALRKQMDQELRLESRFRRLFERNLAAVFTWQSDGTIADCNRAFVDMLGLPRQEDAIGRSLWSFASASERKSLITQLALHDVLSNFESLLQRSDGSPLNLLMNITAVATPESLTYETTALDITELHQARSKAIRESLHDALTGLPNRRRILDYLNKEIEQAKQDGSSIAMLYMDLDGFKLANDSFGHGVGDLLLIQISAGMQACIPVGSLLARVGGDEFLLVMPHLASPAEAEAQARRFLAAVSQPFHIEGHTLSVGVSIGISLFPNDADSAEDVLQCADGAMYAAKRAGKNSLMFFCPEIGSDAHERLILEKQLHGAIRRNEISVHYQPEFDLSNMQLTRFEALARWNHSTLGAIPPVKFIPIAEENGFIDRLGAFVMEKACLEALRWQAMMPYPIQVAVNVSSKQIRNRNFVQEIQEILARTGLTPSLLQIEITETAMIEEDPVVAETLQQLRAIGISLAIDDFGTGYSNLCYLPTRVYDVLKIDRTFLKHHTPQPETRTMIFMLVTLAKQIGMKVIVEGVETQEQLALVQQCGADEAQGYLLGRPMPNPIEACLLPYLNQPAKQLTEG